MKKERSGVKIIQTTLEGMSNLKDNCKMKIILVGGELVPITEQITEKT